MWSIRSRRVISLRSTGLLLSLGFLLSFAGHQESAPTTKNKGKSRVDGGGEVVHLDSAEVERMDSQTRQEVSVQRAGGFELNLWAPESLMIDPHALSVDNRGRAYVAASGRTRTQRAVHSHITDQYSAMLAHQTLEDLRSFLHRELAPKRGNENEDWLPDLDEDGSHDWRDLTVQKERIYRIQDTNEDGQADRSQVTAEDFNPELTNIAGGVLAHDSFVYVGVAPDLWRLQALVAPSVRIAPGLRPGSLRHAPDGPDPEQAPDPQHRRVLEYTRVGAPGNLYRQNDRV